MKRYCLLDRKTHKITEYSNTAFNLAFMLVFIFGFILGSIIF